MDIWATHGIMGTRQGNMETLMDSARYMQFRVNEMVGKHYKV